MTSLCEKQLLSRLSRRDQSAFAHIFDLQMGHVYRFCYSVVLDRQTAEDATQEVFARLWLHTPEWSETYTLKTWLLSVARNVCIDLIRSRSAAYEKHHAYFQSLWREDMISAPSVERDMDQGLQTQKIKHALFTLPARQRQAISLVYYAGIKNGQAAKIMNLSPSVFDTLLARGRRNLRLRLQDQEQLLKESFLHDTA
jgi:RNA polymerase sigma-70 factor (ECF subfamily)